MNVLVLTTDLPFFPGKSGHDFFNLRYLGQRHTVGVVAPLYTHYPAEGVANLERAVAASYLWPRPVTPPPPLPLREPPESLRRWVRVFPEEVRKRMLRRGLGLDGQPSDAYAKLSVFANCAPHLSQALAARSWQAIVLIQSSTEPWLDYLPGGGAKLVYFHDVRADDLQRQSRLFADRPIPRREQQAVLEQEQRACARADLAGFVSELDQQRATRLLRPSSAVGVAPIPVDDEYFTPAPAGWRRPDRPVVLFTGNLSHPPNVDAVAYFIERIWPSVLQGRPDAVLQIVGLHPHDKLKELCALVPQAEIHGDVPDIRPYFWDASVYVVPMRFGGGVRQKIFEAWAMQVPVVCTTMAAEGIDAAHGRHCWLEDEPAQFAARVVGVLGGSGAAVTAHARQAVLAEHTIGAAASRFDDLARRAVHVRRQRPFKLLFDLRWMKLGKAGGVEQMSYELVDALARLDRRNEYRILCPRSAYYEWDFPKDFRCRRFFSDSTEAKFEALQAGLANLLARSVGKPPLLSPEMRALRRISRMDFDMVQSVCGYSFPDVRPFPNILTVHDLQHVHFPEFFTPEARAVRDDLYRESVRHAAHIICISEATRRDLHASYGVPLSKMTTIWNIPSRLAWTPMDPGRRRRLLRRLGLGGPYLFFPAHGWPHKNHRRLVEAFALAAPELPRGMQLVFTGREFEKDHPAREAIEAAGLRQRVVHLGYRSPLEIHALFAGAHALVFPSLFEGFGMPVAEAIIADCPVACSRATSLPEIGGDAAVYFDATDARDMARALVRVSTEDRLRAALRDACRRRKPLFSARRSAVQALSVYRRVFEELYKG